MGVRAMKQSFENQYQLEEKILKAIGFENDEVSKEMHLKLIRLAIDLDANSLLKLLHLLNYILVMKQVEDSIFSDEISLRNQLVVAIEELQKYR